MQRRTFLHLIPQSLSAMFACLVGLPVAVHILSPHPGRHPGPTWRPLGPMDGYPVGSMRLAHLELPPFDWARSLKVKAVYVLRHSADQWMVFSRNCTDLSCPILFDPGSECFFCPCHGGIFSKTGQRMAGPPKRPLYRYATRIHEGMLEIDLQSVPPVT